MDKIQKYETLILNLHDIGCENRCIFCGKHENKGKDICRRIANGELKKLEYLKKNKNIRSLIISGNDPIEYNDFVGFLNKIKEVTSLKIYLQSHCHGFSNLEFLKKVLSVGNIDQIQVPLYGHNENIHDSVTKNKGSFKKVVKALENFKKINFKNIFLHGLFLKQNENHLTEYFNFFSKYKYPINISLPCVPSYKDKFNDNVYDFIPNLEKVRSFFKSIGKNEKLLKQISVYDMPLCIARNISNYSFMNIGAHKGYEHFKNKRIDITRKNNEIVANYRILSKAIECKVCSKYKICQGITNPYIKLYLFKPEPLS